MVHALGILNQTWAQQQFIDRGDAPQLLCLLGGSDDFRGGDPEGSMFAGFAGVHGSISAQAGGLPQCKLRVRPRYTIRTKPHGFH